MVLIAISTALGFATFTLIVTLNRRQIRRLKKRLDTQAMAMIVLAGLINADEPDTIVIPPPKPPRHLRIVRNTVAIAALTLLLRHTSHTARSHPILITATVATVAVTAAVLCL